MKGLHGKERKMSLKDWGGFSNINLDNLVKCKHPCIKSADTSLSLLNFRLEETAYLAFSDLENRNPVLLKDKSIPAFLEDKAEEIANIYRNELPLLLAEKNIERSTNLVDHALLLLFTFRGKDIPYFEQAELLLVQSLMLVNESLKCNIRFSIFSHIQRPKEQLSIVYAMDAAGSLAEAHAIYRITNKIEAKTLDDERQKKIEAAKIRHEPARKTKEFALEIYGKEKFRSKRQAAKKLKSEIMDYGRRVNFIFTSDDAAVDTIYRWFRNQK
jgi:hypothetical protein